MILYIIRHGETDWNTRHKFQGRTDVPLNENGRQVAEWTKQGLIDVAFDVAYTSPLSRAKETAEILLGDRDVRLIEDERIIEMSFGTYEGIEAEKQDENLKKFFKEPESYEAPEGGESIREVLDRTRAFLEELFANPNYQDSTILISTHGAALSGLMCAIKGWRVSDFWKGGLYKNCGFSIVERKDGSVKILKEAIVVYDENRN